MIRVILFLLLYALSFTINSQTKNIEVILNNNGISLEGTLTYSNEKQPLIIWVAGSGNIDRNGNQLPMIKANYIKQFRNEITQQNIAFFSYDKRTANQENFKKFKNIVFEDFVSDVKLIINHFKTDYNFSEIILVGHSQGSLTAMLASEKADKFISLAGAGEAINKTITKQINQQNPMITNTVKAHFKELRETDTIKKVNPFLMSVFAPQNQKFLKSWMHYQPTKEIAKLNIPILIINGKKDLQVSTDNAMKLLNNNQKTKIALIDNMNHVLKEIKEEEDNMKSYISADFPISKELINVISNFIKTK